MIRLYFAPRTRSVRVRWLLEELGLPHELERVTFNVPTKVFAQDTPTGKLPVIVDGDVTIGESGAIIEYILERYGDGRLSPPIGSPARGEFLQWVHFAEGTAFPPLSKIRTRGALDFVERALVGRDYLLGAEFSAADVMMGFTLLAARVLGVLDAGHSNLTAYLARLEARPAFQRAAQP